MVVRTIAVYFAIAGVPWISAAQAEFNSWTDDAGQRRISNLPRAAIEPAGGIARGAHPYSIEGQHARLRIQIERRDAESAATAAADHAGSTPGSDGVPMSVEALRGLLVPGGERPDR